MIKNLQTQKVQDIPTQIGTHICVVCWVCPPKTTNIPIIKAPTISFPIKYKCQYKLSLRVMY